MMQRTAAEPVASAQPDELKKQTQRFAVLFAVIGASQGPGNSGHSSEKDAGREERGLVLEAITERRGRVVKTEGGLIVACFQNASEAVETAIAIQRNAVGKKDRKVPLNIRILIHAQDGTTAEGDLQGDMPNAVAGIADVAKSGRIYVSMEAYSDAQALDTVEFKPLKVSEKGGTGLPSFYEVVWHPEAGGSPVVKGAEAARNRKGVAGPFAHGAALVAGKNAPCFYCGSRKHRAAACPSKHLPYATNGLERLGYLSMDEINLLFSDYLNQSREDLPVIPEPSSKEDRSLTYLAPWSFYELKRVFQLRFLDVVWNATSKADWHKARERRGEGFPEGGMLWFARDCIRTSRLEEAEDLLRRYERVNSGDYRAPCGLAFVEIEKEHYVTAADYLDEALDHQVGSLQKTYLLLLLSRVYEFIPNLSKSDEKLKDALGIDPFCPEATFEQILRYFRGKREADAAKRLVKLIGIYKEYYTAGLISPELAEFHEIIGTELGKLTTLARCEAEKALEDADKEVALVKGFAGENNTDAAQLLALHKEMGELLDKPEALFNYNKAIEMAGRITAECKELDHKWTNRVTTVIEKIEVLVAEAVQRSSRKQEATVQFRPILDRLSFLKKGLQTRAPLDYLSQCEEMEREVGIIEEETRQSDFRHFLSLMWNRFSKDIILSSFTTAALGLVLFPGTIYLLHWLRPDFPSLRDTEIWTGQKAILLVGTFFTLAFAGCRALSNRLKLRDRLQPTKPGED